MSSFDRRPYLTAMSLTQAFLDACHDNLECRLEMVVEIETPTGVIYASDRNKYVGDRFYEALLVFPQINRTLGEWLAPTLTFSQLELELANADGRFNAVLPHGDDYDSWVGKTVTVRIGIAQEESTYFTLFRGRVTEEAGVSRTTKSVKILARDAYEGLSKNFPDTALTKTAYPGLADDLVGKILPYIYGDYTVALEPSPAIVPAYIVNSQAPYFDETPFINVQFRISENDLSFFDIDNVWLKRGDEFFLAPAADIIPTGSGNKTFELDQNTATTWVRDGNAEDAPLIPYLYKDGDTFWVRVKGKDLGSYDDNIVEQARDVLKFGGALTGDFDTSWDDYRDKASPSASALSTFKSRVWEDDPKPAIQYALSLLEQVRLEAFIDRNLKIKINSLHFEDWSGLEALTVNNFDVVEGSFSPALDFKNNFNRARGDYDFHPIDGKTAYATNILRNQASIDQIGRVISKSVTFPNLYEATVVEDQLTEILRLASSFLEQIEVKLTWRSLLLDLGKFATFNVAIGGVTFASVPAMVRDIGVDPQGVSIPAKLWSMGMCPYPGYEPGYFGTVGGYSAGISSEA